MISLFFMILATVSAWAGQVVLQADTTRLAVGETVTLELTVVNIEPDQPPVLQAPAELRVQYAGARTSVSSVNFRTTRSVTYSFRATALAPGEARVPPAEVMAGGKKLYSNALDLVIRARSAQEDPDDQIQAAITPAEAWEGQVVVYSLDFRSRKKILDMRWQPPPFEGLVAAPGSEIAEKSYPVQQGADTWVVQELDTPLVASATGKRTIPPGALQIQTPSAKRHQGFGFGFTETQTDVVATEPLSFVVKARPEAPAGFSGLVGDFVLEATLDPPQVALGESATLTLTLRGNGSLAAFALPPAPAGAGWRAYDDAPEVKTAVEDGRFLAQGTWRRAVVPEQEGTFPLDIELVIFDTTTGAYRALKGPPLSLTVKGGTLSPAVTSFAPAEVQAPEARPSLRPARAESTFPDAFDPLHPGVLAGLLLPGAAALAAARARRRPVTPQAIDPKIELRQRLSGVGTMDLAELGALVRDARETLGERPELLTLQARLDQARFGGGADAGLRDEVARTLGSLL